MKKKEEYYLNLSLESLDVGEGRVFIPVVSVSHTGHSDLQRSPPSGALPISSAPLSAYAQQGKVVDTG